MAADLVLRFPGPPVVSRVRVRRGSLDRLGAFARSVTGARRAALVTDRRVGRLHGRRALAALARAGVTARLVVVPAGERSKSPARLAALWDAFAGFDLDRQGLVVALGGGVVGDLAGFAAATWLRGVDWIGVPTTVIAQVDSALGGKTGIDLDAGKNLVGAFHQPSGVLVDPDLLATLPARHRRAGLAEVVKTGFAVDAALFRRTERDAAALAAGEPAAIERAVRGALTAKARVVQRDPREREGGGRAALNFGHTLGHAIEAARGYRGVFHGEAVAIGLRAAAALSTRLAGLDSRAARRLERLLDGLGLPRRIPPIRVARLLRAMRQDKKRRGGRVRWSLTTRVGHASVPQPIADHVVRSTLIAFGARR